MSEDNREKAPDNVLPFDKPAQVKKPITKEECDGLSALARHIWKLRGLDQKSKDQ